MGCYNSRMFSVSNAGGISIQLKSLSNIPDMDDSLSKSDVSDVFLTLQIFSENEEPYGPKQKTTVFNDVMDATFGECYHTLRIPKDIKDAKLRIKAYDKDYVKRDDKIAHLDIPLSDLIKNDAEKSDRGKKSIASKERVFETRKMQMDTKRRGKKKNEPVSLTFRFLSDDELAQCSLKKRFFLIRHGESLWNEAQSEKNVAGMLAFDHALDIQGIEQCKRLNACWREADPNSLESLEKEFIECPTIMCSPLTRCVQTAFLSLYSHEALKKNGIILQRNLREVKSTIGSLDTLGIMVGAKDIKKRAKECLMEQCVKNKNKKGKSFSEEGSLNAEEIDARFDSIELHANDALSKWWTQSNKYDDEKALRARMNALMGTLRYLQSESAILVGHSLFFREMMKLFLSKNFKSEGLTREELSKCKMGNAAVAVIDVTFPAFPEEKNFFEISQISFLFGSGLSKH